MLVDKIKLASREDEIDYFMRGAHDRDPITDRGNTLPFGVFAKRGIENIDLGKVTVFCGGSASPMLLLQKTLFECLGGSDGASSECFFDYIKLCCVRFSEGVDRKRLNTLIIKIEDIAEFVSLQHQKIDRTLPQGLLSFYENKFKSNCVIFLSFPELMLSGDEEIGQLCSLIEDFSKTSGSQFLIFSNSKEFSRIRGSVLYDLDKRPILQK